jgi:hypothetical protein
MMSKRIGPQRGIMAHMSAVARSGYRLTVLLTAAVVLAQLHPKHRPATVCLLRGLTGIPCPFCGGTTAAVRIGRADLAGALHASPLAVLGAPLFAGWPLLGSRAARLPWAARLGGLVVVVISSELWQLHRIGWV